MMPLDVPDGKSNGKLNCASPLLLVATPGTLPNARGRLAAWLVVHCASALKYQCTVNVALGVLLSVPLIVIADAKAGSGISRPTSPSRSQILSPETDDTADVNTGKFCCRLAPTSVSCGSLLVTPASPRSMP